MPLVFFEADEVLGEARGVLRGDAPGNFRGGRSFKGGEWSAEGEWASFEGGDRLRLTNGCFMAPPQSHEDIWDCTGESQPYAAASK